MSDDCLTGNWPPNEARQSLSNLLSLRDLLSKCFKENDRYFDQVPELAKLLVIRSCGHLEVVSTSCFLAFVDRHSNSVVSGYVSQTYRSWTSPEPKNLRNLLNRLSKKSGEQFAAFLELQGQEFSSELGSLVDKRKKIAHGQNENVTARTALQYCAEAVAVGEWFVEYFRPNGDADDIEQMPVD